MEILACRDCGLQFWCPPEGHRAARVYDAAYFDSADPRRGYADYAGLEAALRSNFARRLRRLGPPPPRARLLDVGAAFGFGVDEALRAGWHASGLELAPSAARVAGPGRSVVGDALRLPFASGSFTALTLWDVLEHLPDPRAMAAEAARVLRPGGWLALSTGDAGSLAARLTRARWHLYSLPEHLFFFTRESLRRLLTDHGLRIESLRAEPAVYPLGYLVERLRKTLLHRAGPAPRFPGSRLPVPVNLFDIVTVFARRGA